MSPPRREDSNPGLDPFTLGEKLGEISESLRRIEDWQKSAPCPAHLARLEKISADMRRLEVTARGHRVSEWLASNWKLVIPLVLALLGAPTIRQCLGEQATEAVARSVRQLEARPPQTKTVVVPLTMPVVLPRPDAEVSP